MSRIRAGLAFVVVVALVVATVILLGGHYRPPPAHNRTNEVHDIDLVVLWVDGTDPEWLEAKQKALQTADPDGPKDGRAANRFENFNEIKYLLRGVDAYAPWIRRVYLVVMGDQFPDGLVRDHPRLRVVRHDEIMPPDILPTFNSTVIETHVHLIPGLAERFIYANDDTFFAAPVQPRDFFVGDRPVFFVDSAAVPETPPANTHRANVQNSARLMTGKYGPGLHWPGHQHQVKSFTKSIVRATFDTFAREIRPTLARRFRSEDGIMFPQLCILYGLHHGLAVAKTLSTTEQARFEITSPAATVARNSFFRAYAPNAKFICVNDNAVDHGGEIRATVEGIFERRFPIASRFEIK